MKQTTDEYQGPLAGLNVIDFGHYYAGPMAGMLLADQGANVIRIVKPGEKELPEQQYRLLNRNKKLLELDLKTPEGKAQALSSLNSSTVKNTLRQKMTISKLGSAVSAVLLVLASSLQAESDYTIHEQGVSDHPPLAPGVIHVPSYDLPLSTLLSEETRAAILKKKKDKTAALNCPGLRYPGKTAEEILIFRKCWDTWIAKSANEVQERFGVQIEPKTIAGVYTEIFTPEGGVPKRNKDRLVINVHGGGFVAGARVSGRIESIPVSAMGEFRVISIDYRQFPEHSYPAATDDVVAVYKELLKSYKPENIAIYGCSAGGVLTGQSLARFQAEDLPIPAAAGIFCAGASVPWGVGDSYMILSPLDGINPLDFRKYPRYDSGADPNDALFAPAMHPEVMAKFPPTLLMSSVRDRALSSVVFTHTQLLKVGVEADLVVWEGLEHGGFLNPDIPEYVDSHNIIVRFFDRYMGRD